MTEDEFQDLCIRIGPIGAMAAETIEMSPKAPWVGPRPPKRPESISGPLSVLLTLHGHCPSKKNGWRMAGDRMVIPAEMKAQIEVLTMQALFQWGLRGPVNHPDVTVRFFVCAARQDEDGMWTTVLDCLQKAGVLVNDNIKHFNGWKHHAPCEFVSEADERVEILVEKK